MEFDFVTELFVSLFLVLGSFLFLVAAIGLVRLPDAMCMAHANAKGTCLGVLLILAALALALQGKGVGFLVLATAIFQLLTIPIAAHLFGRLALHKKFPLWKEKPLEKLP